MSKRRVVVTGVGLVTPVGIGVEKTFEALLAGKSGAGPLLSFDPEGLGTTIACEVSDLDATEYLDPRAIKRLDLYTIYGLIAAKEAMESSGLDLENEDRFRVGCIVGTGIAGIHTLEEQKVRQLQKGNRVVSPLLVPRMMFNAHTGQIALELGLQGPNFAVGSACASASHAIGVAMRTIQYGDADIVFTGGAEAAATSLGFSGFSNMKALSRRNDEPQRASRPFDRERDGFVMGEGAGILVLEERERALSRGATIYGEILGFGSSDDAFHITAPDETGKGPCVAMEQAIRDAGIDKEAIGYVNAHGTSTRLNDKTETASLKQVFGDHAKKLQISSTKSMIGHLLGASGAAELIASLLCLERGVLHPTINYENPDPDCDLDYVPNEAREAKIDFAISNSLGFGGTNCCLAFGRRDAR